MLSVLALRDSTPVYLACGAADMRKSIDSVAAIVTYTFELDPLSAGLFAFCNRGRDKLKVLFWENNGFWLYAVMRPLKWRLSWPGLGVLLRRHNLALIYRQTNRLDLAQRHFGIAAQQQPGFLPAWRGLQEAFQAGGDIGKAQEVEARIREIESAQSAANAA